MNKYIVIDGFAASGKSSVALEVSRLTHWPVMSTGELHRINAFLINEENIRLDLMAEEEILNYLETLKIEWEINNERRFCFSLNGYRKENVEGNLSNDVLINATKNHVVCRFFSDYFLNNIKYNMPIIVEGHGIGNGVFKEEKLKFFCDASQIVRARRRGEQIGISIEQSLSELEKRDRSDANRKVNPVFKSNDMIIINTEKYNSKKCAEIIMEVYMFEKFATADKEIRERALKMGLSIDKVDFFKREDFESEYPDHEYIYFITYYCKTKNRLLLGEGGRVFDEVFPRIKKIKRDLLRNIDVPRGIEIEFSISLDLENVYDGKIYPKEEINSYGDTLIKIEDLVERNPYYKELASEFRIEYGIKTNNGTVIGPDAGLIYGISYIAQSMLKESIRIAEIGAGTCSTPISLLSKKKIEYYYGVDFSSKVLGYYERIFRPILLDNNVDSTFVIDDALKCELPSNIDIFVVGIYYEAQYDFIANRGNEIKGALSNDGMLILQSGLPENLMLSDLLVEAPNNAWPWQQGKSNLRDWFRFIMQVNFKNEIVTIASDNRYNFYRLIHSLFNKYKIYNIINLEKTI